MLLIFASALLYVLSIMWGMQHKAWAGGLEKVAEISLAIALIVFFIIPKKK